jgi:hypothetical protein
MEISHVEVIEDEEPYREVKRSQVRYFSLQRGQKATGKVSFLTERSKSNR